MSEADALVLFMPSGRRGRFAHGTTLLDAARSLGVYVESVCGGRGLCGRCQVAPSHGVFAKHGITSAPPHVRPNPEIEAPYRTRGSLRGGRILSCAARIEGDLVIDVPEEFAINAQIVRKRAEARAIQPDPAIRLTIVDVPPPDLAHPSGDADRLLVATGAARLDMSLLPGLQGLLRRAAWRVGAAVDGDGTLFALWPDPPPRVFGVAFDIGSTTLAGQLVDLHTGRTVAAAGAANPQIRFGEDLMSRVSYAMLNRDGTEALTRTVRQAIAVLIGRLLHRAGVAAAHVVEAVFVGNPVMHHLFLGLDPTELGQAPFALAVSGAVRSTAGAVGGLGLPAATRVYLPPCIAGHVGADAAAVALADGPHLHDEPTLVVDIGTNAELLLGHRGRVLAASSPTGPAFEGAQISGGQRAAPGAIERVRIDPVTLVPRVRVIGVETWSDEAGFAEATEASGVTGLCGSGIIEAVAEMFLVGIVAADGTIRGRDHPRLVRDGRTWRYVLWDGAVPISITQADIRAIQLAKAALYAGARLLMDRLGIDRVARIKLAGAFGSHVAPLHAMALGLIPDCPLDRVTHVGNSAGTGARMILASRAHRAEVEALVTRIEKIETAMEPTFQPHFVEAMAFPHARDPFPSLAGAVTVPTQVQGARPRRRASSNEM